MSVDEQVREAELAFLNAPFRDDGWLHAVQQLAGVTGSATAQLCGIAGGMELPHNILSDAPHDPHGHLHNPLLYGRANWRIGVTNGVLSVQHDIHYAAFRSRHPTAFYDDAVSDLDVPFGCQTALSVSGDDLLGLALLRSRRNGPCDEAVLTAFRRLAWQAQRAMRVQIALGQESAELMLAGPSVTGEATLLLDRFGALAALSQAAERLFDEPSGLRLDGLRPLPASRKEADEFDSALTRLLASDGVSGPILHQFALGRSAAHPRGRWRAVLARLPQAACEIGFAPELALTVTPLTRA